MVKLFRFLKPYRWQIFVVLVLVFLQTLGDLYLPTLTSDIINEGVMAGDVATIWDIGKIMLLVAGLSAILSIASSYFSAKIAMGFGTVLRNKIFERVESFSLREFDEFGTATLITRTTNDINQVQMVTIMIFRMMVSAPMMAIGGLTLAYSKNANLTGVLGVAILVLGLTIAVLARKVIPLFKLVQGKVDKINLVLREKLTGIRVIRAFDTVERENKRFDDVNNDLTNNYITVNRIMAFMMPSIMLIMNITSLSILWFAAIKINVGTMDLGDLSAFTQYTMQIMMSMLMLSMMFIMVPRAHAAAIRIDEVIVTEPSVVNPEIIQKEFSVTSTLEFQNVAFSYPGAEESVLEQISFQAKPDKVTAIIGSTGSGKSTIVNLIPRFYDITQGNILIDGVDIKEISLETLRDKIGFVPQKSVLFSGSIADNIRFGSKDAPMEEVIEAAKVAEAYEFIENMEEGFDHYISQGGTNVSGGQKQRLAIARAILKKPEIYVFDDSFSALDFKTDAKVRKSIKNKLNDATVIIVAQRVGTIMDADQIIVLEKGKIQGIGTHHELLNSCEVYKEIVSSQLTKEDMK